MNNRCSLIALAWTALVADGADPGASETIFGAFGFASLKASFPAEPPPLETLVGTHDLFNGSLVTVIAFLPADGNLVLGRLFNAPGRHFTVAVLTTAGTSVGLAVSGCTAWRFDSHGKESGQGGAFTEAWFDFDALAEILFCNTCAIGPETQSQHIVLRSDLSLPSPAVPSDPAAHVSGPR